MGRAVGAELRDENIIQPAAEVGLDCIREGKKIQRSGQADNHRVADRVHCDTKTVIIPRPAQITGVYQVGSVGPQLEHEGIVGAAGKGPRRSIGREIRRAGHSRQINLAGVIYGDCVPSVRLGAADKG